LVIAKKQKTANSRKNGKNWNNWKN
jgi:hypothetical protein